MSSSTTENGALHATAPEPAGELVDVTMPQMGVSVADGTVAAWRKRVGERVEADETICEITTDKVDTEIPAPAAGTVAEILVEVDQTVTVGTVLARIEAGAGESTARPREAGGGGEAKPGEAGAGAHATPGPAARSARYSPVVQRIAMREGVDLAQVAGTGRGERVRKQDVLAYIARRHERREDATDESPPAARTAAEPAQAGHQTEPPLHIESPYREPGAEEGDSGERLSRMRRAIARHMVSSLQTAAHCTSVVEADFSRVQAAREALGLTHLPFVAACAVGALREHPDLNATLEGERLTRHRAVNLGIAVSLGADGLIVPVVHNAHELSAEGLAARIAALAARARARELEPREVQGATFTITNPGGYGTLVSTPIINQPQVAILDLEAVVRRPVVVADERGGEAIAIRPMAYLCLSWDHRALDGAMAAQFLAALRRRIESWEVPT